MGKPSSLTPETLRMLQPGAVVPVAEAEQVRLLLEALRGGYNVVAPTIAELAALPAQLLAAALVQLEKDKRWVEQRYSDSLWNDH